jgi:hypothetical protein
MKAPVGADREDIHARFAALWQPEPNSGCWLWLGAPGPSGYGRIRHHAAGEVHAHRVSWTVHNGPVPAGLFVCHRCDVRLCVNPDHLFLGTNRDNMNDAVHKGRVAPPASKGETNPASKLTLAAVREILASRESSRAIAPRFGVTSSAIRHIRRGVIWGHAKEPTP